MGRGKLGWNVQKCYSINYDQSLYTYIAKGVIIGMCNSIK